MRLLHEVRGAELRVLRVFGIEGRDTPRKMEEGGREGMREEKENKEGSYTVDRCIRENRREMCVKGISNLLSADLLCTHDNK